MAVGLVATMTVGAPALAAPVPAAQAGTADAAAMSAPREGDSAAVTTISDLRATKSTLTGGEATVVRFTVTSSGTAVAGQEVAVRYAGRTRLIETDAAGRGAISITNLPAGKPKVIVRYAGDETRAAATAELQFTVTPRKATIDKLAAQVVSASAATITYTLTAAGKPLPKAKTAVTVRGKTMWVHTDAKGAATLTVKNLKPGMVTIRVRYFGDATTGRADTSTEATITVPCPATARACVDLTNSLAWLQADGEITFGPVPITSGRPGLRTRQGTFRVFWKHQNHVSSYYGTPMPNSIFFDGGIAFHEGSLQELSHGCVHLSKPASEAFWTSLRVGDRVYVTGVAPY